MTERREVAMTQTDPTEPGMECGHCGSTDLQRADEAQKFLYGPAPEAVELSAVVPVYTCRNCGEAFTTGEAEVRRHDAVCHHLGVLTPDEIRALRARRRWSQTELARQMRCGEASVKRWETGALIQNGPHDLLLRLLADRDGARVLELVAGSGEREREVAQLQQRWGLQTVPPRARFGARRAA